MFLIKIFILVTQVADLLETFMIYLKRIFFIFSRKKSICLKYIVSRTIMCFLFTYFCIHKNKVFKSYKFPASSFNSFICPEHKKYLSVWYSVHMCMMQGFGPSYLIKKKIILHETHILPDRRAHGPGAWVSFYVAFSARFCSPWNRLRADHGFE